MNSPTNTNPETEATTGLEQAVLGIHAARKATVEVAQAIAKRFFDKREALSEGRFANLNLLVRVRQDGRSVQIFWALLHFRGGKRVGISGLPKPRTATVYDISTLKRHAPDWLQQTAIECEIECRPLREVLNRLTAAEREIRVCGSRFGAESSLLLPTPVPHSADELDESANDDASFPDPFAANQQESM